MKRTTPSWKLPGAGRALLALGIAAAALGCDRPGKPDAATELTATPQAVTLIQEAKTRCVKVAKTGIERLRGAEQGERNKQEEALESGTSYDPGPRWVTENMAETTLDKYLKDEAGPELAAADHAGELIRGLMPQVKKEASPEIGRPCRPCSTARSRSASASATPGPRGPTIRRTSTTWSATTTPPRRSSRCSTR